MPATPLHHFNALAPFERQTLLDQARKRGVTLTLWKKGASSESSHYKILKIQHDLLLFLRTAAANTSLASHSEELLEREVLANLSLGRYQYFASGTLHLYNSRELYLEMAPEVYKCDKRANFRIMASKDQIISATIDGLRYFGLDLSAGGIGLQVPCELKDQFAIGQRFVRLQIQLNQVNFNITTAEVVNQIDLKEHPTDVRVGIKFTTISDAVDRDLCRQMNNELYQTLKAGRG